MMRFPDLRTVDLNLLLVLHSLLETRSTVMTAQRLHMSQPAVSRALARLRLLFNDRLLMKGARGMVATDRAAALSEPLVDILQRLEVFLESPNFAASRSERIFRIATTDYGALALLPNLLGAIAAEAPRCRIEVVNLSRDVFRALAAGDLDLILVGDLPFPPQLNSAYLFTDEYQSAVRPGHPAAAHLIDGRIDLDTFLAHPHVRVSVFDDRTDLDEALNRMGLRRQIRAQFPYFAAAAILTASTEAILTLPIRALRHLARQHDLMTFKLPIEIRPFNYSMVWHERTNADFGAIWLRQKMIEAADDGAEAGSVHLPG